MDGIGLDVSVCPDRPATETRGVIAGSGKGQAKEAAAVAAGSESVTRKCNLSCKVADVGVLGAVPQSFMSIQRPGREGYWLVSG